MTAGKPVHPFAVILWALAALSLVVVPTVSWFLYNNAAETAPDVHHASLHAALVRAAWVNFADGLQNAAELTAAGFVIELLDTIRWTLPPPEERVSRRRVRS